MEWQTILKTEPLSISNHDQLDTATKAFVPGDDPLFEKSSQFLLNLSGEVVHHLTFAEAMTAFLKGQVDMVVTSISSLTQTDTEALESLILSKSSPFSIRPAANKRIIIDNGCLEL